MRVTSYVFVTQYFPLILTQHVSINIYGNLTLGCISLLIRYSTHLNCPGFSHLMSDVQDNHSDYMYV